jgi:hypothetical protein
MIRKLAEELAFNSTVPGTNDIRPLDPPAPPEEKPDADVTSRYGWPDSTQETTKQDQSGVLDRALTGFRTEAGKYNDALASALGDHVRKVTGSVSMSRAAVRRHRTAKEE